MPGRKASTSLVTRSARTAFGRMASGIWAQAHPRRVCNGSRRKISELLVPGNKGSWPEVRDQLNRLLSGWSAYFSYGTRVPAYRAVDDHVYDRVRHFLGRRHNVQDAARSRFSRGDVFGELGVLHLRRAHIGRAAVGRTVTPVGKPDAGNQHVRFDERGRETERAIRLKPPRPSSTLPHAAIFLICLRAHGGRNILQRRIVPVHCVTASRRIGLSQRDRC